MKIKAGFVLKEVAGCFVIVPIGENLVDFAKMMTLNDTSAFLWEQLKEETTIVELAQAMTKEYAIDEQTATKDIEEFISLLRAQKVLVE